MENLLNEITVMPVEKILEAVANKLEKDYLRKRRKQETYFFRQTSYFGDKRELAEAFVNAHQAVNLRKMAVISGRRFRENKFGEEVSQLASSNLHHFLELGPMISDVPFWRTTTTPIYSRFNLSQFQKKERNPYSAERYTYRTRCQTLKADDGREIYKITLTNPGGGWLVYNQYVEGTMYVDKKTYALLRFEGELKGMSLDVSRSMRRESTPIDLHFEVEYANERGFTEVDVISCTMTAGYLQSTSLVYKLGRKNIPTALKTKKKWNYGENMFSTLDMAGYDSTLWTHDIVRLTNDEERLIWKVNRQGADPEDTLAYTGEYRPMIERLMRFSQTIPQEKVYLHMDNTSYFLGDTIWFSAYTRQTNSDAPAKVSNVLYAELLNEDGYLVERKLIEMKEGRGNGFFALDKEIQYSGFYELRAYTRWQLNWGVTDHIHSKTASSWFLNKTLEKEYYTDYDKLYSRVFPVYDKPQAPGEYTRYMTRRPLNRIFKKDMDEEERELTLTLFPEGGNLVSGVPNRVAFEAKWNDGKELEGTLNIDGNTIPAVNRGRGVFRLIPEKGMEREITFTTKDGKTVSAKLPKPEENGVALSVERDGDDWVISTHLAGLSPDSLAMTIMHEGKVEEFSALSSKFKVQGSRLPAGIHQVTVFDTQGRVYADRLFFVTNPELAKPTLTVSGLKDEYEPYEKIELQVATTTPLPQRKGMGLSLSVRDGYQQDQLYDNGNIMTEMLLASEVKGFIPNPGWYFETDDEQHRQALDLLMMTQGWRRFVWKDMAVKGEWDLTQPDEQTPVIQGRVIDTDVDAISDERWRTDHPYFEDNEIEAAHKARTIKSDSRSADLYLETNIDKNPKSELRVIAKFVNVETQEPTLAETETRQGRFRFQLPRFYGAAAFSVNAIDTMKWEKGEEGKWEPKKKDAPVVEFFVQVQQPYPRFVKPYQFYQSHLSSPPKGVEIDPSLLADSTHLMREISVKARRRSMLTGFNDEFPAFIIDAYEARNDRLDAGMLFADDSIARTYVGDYGLAYPYADTSKSHISVRYGLGPTRRTRPQYVDFPLDSVYSPKYLRSFPKSSILQGRDESLISPYSNHEFNDFRYVRKHDKYVIYTDYSPRLKGSKRYQGSNLPYTYVVIYPYADGSARIIHQSRYYILPGFAYPAEFYSPDYSKQTPPEPNDYRRTLYWNPDLQLDEKGQAHVTLWNNSRTTHPNVEAAGQTAEGGLLWNKQ